LPHQELKSTEASAAQALALVTDLLVDIAVPKQAAALLLPLALAQAALDAALAMAEPPAYLGVHWKYLHVWDEG
jgi:hypothetical protein